MAVEGHKRTAPGTRCDCLGSYGRAIGTRLGSVWVWMRGRGLADAVVARGTWLMGEMECIEIFRSCR